MTKQKCGNCGHYIHCSALIQNSITPESSCDFNPSKFKQKEPEVTAIQVCQSVHQFCLKKGLEHQTTDEQQLAYQQVIIFLTRTYGNLRKETT